MTKPINPELGFYRQTSDISRAFVGNKIASQM